MTQDVKDVQEVQEEKVAPQLTLADLVSALQVISAATNRGAFKANELSTVGGVYDRISAYVEHVQPPQEEAAPEQEQKEAK